MRLNNNRICAIYSPGYFKKESGVGTAATELLAGTGDPVAYKKTRGIFREPGSRFQASTTSKKS